MDITESDIEENEIEMESNEEYVEFLKKTVMLPDGDYISMQYAQMAEDTITRNEHIQMLADICVEHDKNIKPDMIAIFSM